MDEAGDTTFYGKGKIDIIGKEGVSKALLLGMVKIKEPLRGIRQKVIELQNDIANDPYFNEVPSIQKKIKADSFYFHATDDPPEVRKIFYEFIKELDCSFEAVVGSKNINRYLRKHNGKESEFYAELLSHLLKNKLGKSGKLVLNMAVRGKTTKNTNLKLALKKAMKRHLDNPRRGEIKTEVVFNVQNHITEPLLNIADYFCWAIYRVFERGETRYYNFLADKVSLVIDLYNSANYEGWKNYYNPQNKLTANNRI